MNVVKVNFLFVTLLSFGVATVGSASAQQFRTASLESTRVLTNGIQNATNSKTLIEITGAGINSKSTPKTTENQTAASPTEQFSQASFHQTVQPASNTLAAAPLTTLGPNDDFARLVEQAPGVVLIDFYADWCGPCRRQGGILHEMQRSARQNNASIIKVNVDQHRRLASAFNVTSMPTLILIKNGQIIERQTGMADHQKIASLLSR